VKSANLVAEEKREEKREETGGGPLLTGENITETERQLALIWGEVLKVDALGCDDDYFDLGGNSLSGAQIQSRISERLDVEVEFEAIYDYSTLREFAAYLDTRKSSTNGGGAHHEPETQESSIPRVQRADEYALSYAQERLFNLYQMEPDSPFYNMPGAFRLKGSLRRDALEQTLNEILRRHEILRTTYKISDERAAQCISATKSVPWSFVSLKHLPAMEREAAASRLAAEEAARPFNLMSEIPLRVTLLELSGDEHVLLLTIHHIASDGWSIGIFFEEFSELYQAYAKGISPSLTELPIQYVDYADWQRNWLSGARWETQLDFWKDQLRGVPPLLALPTDRTRPSRQTFRGAVSTHEFPLALTESLNQLSRQEGVTLFMTLLAAFNVLLYRYSGQTDICVGSPVANRPRVETERLIGFFANTLALRNDLSGNPGFREFLQRVKGATLKAYAHQDMPFEKLVQSLQPERNPGYSPIFQVVFVLQNSPLQALELPGLALSLLETDSKAAKFVLTL
jgi:acyl carrier protein